MDLKAGISDFLNYLQYEKRFSTHTVTAYSTDLISLGDFLNEQLQITDISDIRHTAIRSWIVSMMEDGISARSVNRKITALKSFYRYLLRQGVVTENPMVRIVSPKTPKKLPVFVERSGMDSLLDSAIFPDTEDGRRDRLIMEMFYGTGMRLSELINLKKKDIDIQNQQLKVLGKRNKERLIPLHRELAVLLDQQKEGDTEYFFSRKGRKLNEKFVYRLVNKYLAGVTTISKKSPHVLRHTFATHMLNNGADLNAIKELLGHASLAATQVYTHNTVEKLKNIHKQAHPKA